MKLYIGYIHSFDQHVIPQKNKKITQIWPSSLRNENPPSEKIPHRMHPLLLPSYLAIPTLSAQIYCKTTPQTKIFFPTTNIIPINTSLPRSHLINTQHKTSDQQVNKYIASSWEFYFEHPRAYFLVLRIIQLKLEIGGHVTSTSWSGFTA